MRARTDPDGFHEIVKLFLKVFVFQRHHNGTSQHIIRLASACTADNVVVRTFRKRLGRRLNRRYGCFVSPLARIGDGLLFPHPVGIVIGDGVVIGERCVIYQNVTLGAARRGEPRLDRYPTLEDDVTVYAGAVIVGPVRIGRGAVVAANAVVTGDVPPDSVAVGMPARSLPRSPAAH